MNKFIDYWLDRTTMYRVVLYYLIAIIFMALGASIKGLLPYSVESIALSTVLLLVVSIITNTIFAKVYDAPVNLESTYITALILACILPPITSIHDLPLIFWGAALATGSKYILAIGKKHLFNPAAIAVVLTGLWLGQPAIWWIGTPIMAPVILVGGLLMVRKLRHWDLVLVFILTTLLVGAILTLIAGHNPIQAIQESLLRSPLLFFAFVMLTEPLTSPTTKWLQIAFGLLVGFLYTPQIHIASWYLSPELALVLGNLFAYIVSPKIREALQLRQQKRLAPDVLEFDFIPSKPLRFKPGQYLEFTLPHPQSDSRGTRRYFTLASSPTESDIKLGVKLYSESSSYKVALTKLKPGDRLMAGQLAGDFILPKSPKQKLVFIAGGIGITPFRSMLKFLVDHKEVRPITVLYANKSVDEIVYRDVLSSAQDILGTNVIYALSGSHPKDWAGHVGRIDAPLIKRAIPDLMTSLFYLSGPHIMVTSVEEALLALGVKHQQIKKDFFPGLA